MKNPRKNFLDYFFGRIKKLNSNPLVASAAMKLVSGFLIIGLSWMAISAIGSTTASFNDTEISIDNTFSAGTLFFSLYHGQDNFVSENKSDAMEPCDSVTRTIKIWNEGTIPLFYSVYFEKISGDDDFCDYLHLDAKLEGQTKYPPGGNSKLPDFVFSSSEALASLGAENWQFKISLSGDVPDSLKGKTCNFNFVFIGRDTMSVGPSEGFSDTKKISSAIISADWGDNEKGKEKNNCSGGKNEENNEDDDDGNTNNENENYHGNNGDQEEDFFVDHDPDMSSASEYDAKDHDENSDNPEDTEEELVIPNDNLEDLFVRHGSDESNASGYASNDGEKENGNKKE